MKNKLMKGLISAAAVAAVPLSAVADESNLNLYGTVDVRAISADGNDLDTQVSTLRLGVKGVQDLPSIDSMDIRWQIEFDLPKNSVATGGNDTGDVSVRKASVSMQGDFGEVILGRQNNLAAGAFLVDQFKNGSGAFIQGSYRVGNAIGYVTPNMGGMKAFIQMANDADADDENNDVDATIAGLEYSNDTIFATLTKYEVDSGFPSGVVDLTSLGVSASFGNFKVFGTLQDEAVSGTDVFGLGLAYSANDWTYKVATHSFESDSSEGAANYLLASRSLGNGVSAFAQYVDFDSAAEASGKGDAISVGLAASFSQVWNY